MDLQESAYNVLLLSRGKVLEIPWGCYPRASGKSDSERMCTSKQYMYSIMLQISYRRLWDRPGLCREATVPCLFIPFDLGRGVMPFETLHRSRRDPLGP